MDELKELRDKICVLKSKEEIIRNERQDLEANARRIIYSK